MAELVVQGPAPAIAMDNNSSPKADKTPEASPDAPFTRFIELDGRFPGSIEVDALVAAVLNLHGMTKKGFRIFLGFGR